MSYEGVPEDLTASVNEIFEANDKDAIELEARLIDETVNDPSEEQ